jgi:Lactonase, 7-bladed beta-propeller
LLFPLVPDTQINDHRVIGPSGDRVIEGQVPLTLYGPIQFLGEQMLKKLGGVVAFVGLCALSLFLVNCGSSSSRPSGVLYVLTQGSNGVGNNVSTFAMDLNSGGLSLVNSNASTCVPAGGSCGLPVDILLDPTGATAFVLNQGVPCPEVFDTKNNVWICDPAKNAPVAPTIYPYTVNSDGSLSAPGGAITWSCGAASTCANSDLGFAMSRDATGQFLFVIDQGSSPSPGTATPPVYPTCPHVPTGPTDVCPSISVFKISSAGLTLASGSPFYLSKIPSALSAITFTASGSTTAQAQELLFVTNNQDICTQPCIAPSPHNDNTVSVYVVNSDGTLKEQALSPYAVAAVNPISVLAVDTNPIGQNSGGVFVYVGNEDSSGGHINPFQVCTVVGNNGCTSEDVQNSLMTPLETCTQQCIPVPPSSAGQTPVAMVVDPTNTFLYVVAEGSNQVFGFKIVTTAGTLTALSPPNLPTGSRPVALALHPSVKNTSQFLYTSNSASSNISGFTLSTTSGVMNSLPTVITPAAPSGMTAR